MITLGIANTVSEEYCTMAFDNEHQVVNALRTLASMIEQDSFDGAIEELRKNQEAGSVVVSSEYRKKLS